MEVINADRNDVREAADNVTKQIEKIEEELSVIFAAKDEKREAYWKARYDFKQQRDSIAHIEWMQRQKERVLLREAEREETIKERENTIKNMPHPFLKELDTCEHLIAFLHTLKVRAGLEADSEQVARETQQDMLKEMNQKAMQKKIEEGKVEAAMSKKERDAAAMVQVGGKGKRKGKKQKNAQEFEDAFNIDLVVVKKFSLLGVSAPVVPEDLDERIKEIEEKKAWYEENGAAKLKEQVAEFSRMADEEDQELKAEEELAAKEEQQQSRGGRGGYGRGRGGGDRGGRGGYGRGGRGRGAFKDQFRVKGEFEGESDDEERYDMVQKPVKKQKSKGELKMVVDDENYPTLGGEADL